MEKEVGAPLFENDRVLVIDKPAGRNVIPGRGEDAAGSLRADWEKILGCGLWVVHRLDRDTSGVLVFAKDAEAHRVWCAGFANRRVRKTYMAIVRGSIPLEGRLTAPLRAFGSGRVAPDPRGKPCETLYRTRSRGREAQVLEVVPVTGRRHQIRAHLTAAGAPVYGDRLYGPPPRPVGGAPRLMLHAHRLEFAEAPGGRLAVTSVLPEVLQAWARVVGADQIVYLTPGGETNP